MIDTRRARARVLAAAVAAIGGQWVYILSNVRKENNNKDDRFFLLYYAVIHAYMQENYM
jgi:hypothetical protein